jgi:hypothetical protein
VLEGNAVPAEPPLRSYALPEATWRPFTLTALPPGAAGNGFDSGRSGASGDPVVPVAAAEGISAERRHDAGRWLGLTEGAHGSIAPEAMTIRSLRAAALVLALGSPAGEFGRRVGTNQATRRGATSSMGSRPLAVRIPTGLRAQK